MAIIRKQEMSSSNKSELDTNKTPLTHKVTALAAAYMAAGGFKPVETEVSVAFHWVADLASFVYPTNTEIKQNLKLRDRFGIPYKQHELYYRFNMPLTGIVEVKVSYSDFKKDLNTKFSGVLYPAHLCYLAYPNGMIPKEEIPKGWIGIETAKDGGRINKVHNTWNPIHGQNPGDVTDLIAQVAIRRHHRTHYAEMRDFIKAHNAKRNNDKKIENVQWFLRTLSEWLKNDGFYKEHTLRELLDRQRIKVPKYLDETIAFFENMKQEINE